MRLNVVGFLADLVLRGGHRLADAADLEVEIGEAVLEQSGVRVGVERELVLLHRLGRVVRAAGVDRHIFVETRETVVVVGGGAIRHSRRSGAASSRSGRSLLATSVCAAKSRAATGNQTESDEERRHARAKS